MKSTRYDGQQVVSIPNRQSDLRHEWDVALVELDPERGSIDSLEKSAAELPMNRHSGADDLVSFGVLKMRSVWDRHGPSKCTLRASGFHWDFRST
jgi:hypothetical protein